MKCPNCNGYGTIGKSVPNILHGKGAIFADCECDVCHGTGEVEQNNFEYYQTCSIEELAEFLSEVSNYEGVCTVCDECTVSDHKECKYEGQDWIKWLKEKHE